MPAKTPQKVPVAPPAPAKKPATPAPEPRAKGPPPPPAGMYPGLGIQDETGEFGDLGSRERTDDIRGVVLHRTESPSMESTRNSYREQMKHGNHVGAHYLVGSGGETSLTVPTDKVTAHVRGNQDANWKGANAWSVGIENVGMPSKVDPKKPLKPQVEALNLSPGMKKRLLAMDDKALGAALADSDNEVHTDISGPQKRANWNLVGSLATDHHLDIAKDVQPHEAVDYKTLGEGEPIKEFLLSMKSYPDRIAALKKKVDALKANPAADPKQLAALEATLAQEEATWDAVKRDKTPAENNQLDAERILHQPGEATAREGARAGFYDNFWKRSQGLDQAVSS